jgi:hypothetical protein
MSDAPRRRPPGRTAAVRPTAADATPAPAPDVGDGPEAPRPSASTRGAARVLSDGRVQMLVYLPPALVKAVKHAALDADTSASHVVAQALADWLARTARPP